MTRIKETSATQRLMRLSEWLNPMKSSQMYTDTRPTVERKCPKTKFFLATAGSPMVFSTPIVLGAPILYTPATVFPSSIFRFLLQSSPFSPPKLSQENLSLSISASDLRAVAGVRLIVGLQRCGTGWRPLKVR